MVSFLPMSSASFLRLYGVNLKSSAPASPAPPYGITVLECVRDSMVLSWKQPTFIGGADITGYFVDYREVVDGVPGKWHEANVKAVSERAYRVSSWEAFCHPDVLQQSA